MTECIRLIKFEHFRGLPENAFKLKGKSLVILGANGKGKSALVDGIEFVFSGQVARFTGTGTGSISHDDAVKHVKSGGDPEVTLSLSPSNGEISRKLSSNTVQVTDREPVVEFLNQHPNVDGFILRRAKILDFICDQDADRYQKFVQLLGISKIDTLQRRFVSAEQQTNSNLDSVNRIYRTKLAVFNDPANRFYPSDLTQIFIRISEMIKLFDLDEPESWADMEAKLDLLKEKRPQANNEKIDVLTRALVSIETPLSSISDEDIQNANNLREKFSKLADTTLDAPRSKVIKEGEDYLASHGDETQCPLCEAPFLQSLEDLLARLKIRKEALQELHEAESSRTAILDRIKQYADSVALQLKNDLQHSELFKPDTKSALRNARATAIRFSRLIARASNDDFNKNLALPDNLSDISDIRSALAVTLNAQKKELVSSDSIKLEIAIALIERGIASWEGINGAEVAVTKAREVHRRAVIANNAFNDSRETAIQHVFNQISDTVLDYYKRLHDLEGAGEKSECTAIELKSTSRAAAGGLRLAIQFLGLANSKDPRAYLSEGHLDSLGLCIFLAAVRIFNPSGTLLVLDDVLTSIDKEHRRRVGELLLSEFQDFQVILTTHDEHWHDLLISTARAFGAQDKWRYIKLEDWSIDTGPTLSIVKSSWSFIDENLTEAKYRNLGGPFRHVIEDFLKRTAVKIELKVKFKVDGKYTAGDFVTAGIQDVIRGELIKLEADNEKAILIDIARVFGQDDLINYLSHDNPGRLEITFDQASDFVSGLKSLTARCEKHRLIKGR